MGKFREFWKKFPFFWINSRNFQKNSRNFRKNSRIFFENSRFRQLELVTVAEKRPKKAWIMSKLLIKTIFFEWPPKIVPFHQKSISNWTELGTNAFLKKFLRAHLKNPLIAYSTEAVIRTLLLLGLKTKLGCYFLQKFTWFHSCLCAVIIFGTLKV